MVAVIIDPESMSRNLLVDLSNNLGLTSTLLFAGQFMASAADTISPTWWNGSLFQSTRAVPDIDIDATVSFAQDCLILAMWLCLASASEKESDSSLFV